MTASKKSADAKSLRQNAEVLLKGKYSASGPKFSETETKILIHELEVHHIELELQNEQLIQERSQAEELARKYSALYNFAPTGYYTFSKEGRILELNLYGAQILGKDRPELLNSAFGLFVTVDTKPVYDDFLRRLFESKNQETCLLTLSVGKNFPIYVQLIGRFFDKHDHCLVTLVDITESKQIQKKILNTITLIEENERSYFSDEIHDTLGPLLAAAKAYQHIAINTTDPLKHTENLQRVQELLENSYVIVKEISDKLSPNLLKDFGLIATIRRYIDRLKETSILRFSFKFNDDRRFDHKVEVMFYRIVMEFIANTIKHANATHISLSLNRTGNKVQLHYKDDGTGFEMKEVPPSSTGYGLFTIRNRVQAMDGEIRLNSSPGKGVDYRVTLYI